MSRLDYIRFFLIALIGTAVMMLILTGCISPGYHQRKMKEIEQNTASRDKDVIKFSQSDYYLCPCGQFHRRVK